MIHIAGNTHAHVILINIFCISISNNIINNTITKFLSTYISETSARNLQRNSPKGHGYCCQYTLRSLGNPGKKKYSFYY